MVKKKRTAAQFFDNAESNGLESLEMLIIASHAKQKIKPPIPEQAALISLDRLHFFYQTTEGGWLC